MWIIILFSYSVSFCVCWCVTEHLNILLYCLCYFKKSFCAPFQSIVLLMSVGRSVGRSVRPSVHPSVCPSVRRLTKWFPIIILKRAFMPIGLGKNKNPIDVGFTSLKVKVTRDTLKKFSDHYIENFLSQSFHISHADWSRREHDLYWFWVHLVKGHKGPIL